ncbi:MAG TPA: flagellar hook-basal body complex protein, partial [Tepidisphaeraceae bacterium]
LGATVASIEKDFTTGSLEPTGKATDLAVDGDGFFVVQSDSQKFTRDGSFVLNANNELVSTAGDFVQGFGVDANFNVVPGKLQNVNIPLGSSTSAKATENMKLEGNLNAAGAVASGASILNSQQFTLKTGATSASLDANTLLTDLAAPTALTTQLFNSGDVLTLAGQKGGRDLDKQTLDVTGATTLGDLETFFQNGLGIDTNVPANPNPLVPTPGVSVDVTGANGVLTVTGNVGAENALAVTSSGFTNSTGGSPLTFADGQNSAGIQSDPNGESVNTSMVAYDSLGTPINVSITAVLEDKANTGNTWRFYANSGDSQNKNLALGSGTLTFDSAGKLTASTGTTISIDRSGTGAGTPMAVKVDFSSMSSLTSRDSEMVMSEQDGSPIGRLDSFSIGSDGRITGSFSNGLTRNLGQLALANFNNQQGLIDQGGNMFVAGPNSGVPIIAAPQTLGSGSIRAGALELSNVDLSKEFVNLIISSTGFSASSRVISTSDQLLTELLNSSR